MPTHSNFTNNIGLPNTAANAMQNFTQEYAYDELGNMMQLKSVGQWTRDYFYNFSQNNYLLGHTNGQRDYTYDAHGNMLSMPHLQAMHWDYNDWLRAVDLDATGNKANYVYDSAGERVRKVVVKGNIKEERLYFGDYEIYRKFVSGVLETERATVNISDDKAKVATVDTLTVDQGSLTVNPVAVIRYQLDNHLGSASLELDESADIISYEEYHPFGTTSYRSGRTETETSQKRYKYVGKERDEETGLYYYGFRYYAAWLCRFVSVDPLQFDYPHYTPFQYAGNKPITFIDLDGKETTDNEKTGVDTNGQQNKQESSNATWEFTKGTGRGLWGGLKGTWNFITDDAWKAETWIGTGNLILGLALTQHNPAGVATLMEVDEKLGTNTFGAVSGLHGAIDQGVDKFTNGNWGDRGEIFGSTLYAIGESVIGSKGAGLVTKTKFGANLISKTKNAARASATTWNSFQKMTAGQFATRAEAAIAWNAYKKANGIVTGTTRSMAQRSAFLKEAATSGKYPSWMNPWLSKGKVPPGYHVDHYKALFDGGLDIPANMRLKDISTHINRHRYYRP